MLSLFARQNRETRDCDGLEGKNCVKVHANPKMEILYKLKYGNTILKSFF